MTTQNSRFSSTEEPEYRNSSLDNDDIDRTEPLLGGPGTASQNPSQPLRMNIIIGTAPLAQIGVWGIALTIWYNVIFRADWILFSFHPLLNSTALILVTNALLLLQPTHTPEQKRIGAVSHGVLNSLALASFTTAVIIILYTKAAHGAAHFTTAHGRVGLITYMLLIIQTSVGIAMFYFPQVFGSVAKGKAVWKYHRASGYIVWSLILVNCVLGTQSTWFVGVWDNLWVWIVFAVLAFVGLVSRIRLSKMKFM